MKSRTINIKGLDKAAIVASLYNFSILPNSEGCIFEQVTLGEKAAKAMSVAEAKDIIAEKPKLTFQYVHGKPLKVDISGDELNPAAYDDSNGKNVAAHAIQHVINPSDASRKEIEKRLAKVKKTLAINFYTLLKSISSIPANSNRFFNSTNHAITYLTKSVDVVISIAAQCARKKDDWENLFDGENGNKGSNELAITSLSRKLNEFAQQYPSVDKSKVLNELVTYINTKRAEIKESVNKQKQQFAAASK